MLRTKTKRGETISRRHGSGRKSQDFSALSFFLVRSAGGEKIKVEWLLLKLGSVEEAAAATSLQHTHTHTSFLPKLGKVLGYKRCSKPNLQHVRIFYRFKTH